MTEVVSITRVAFNGNTKVSLADLHKCRWVYLEVYMLTPEAAVQASTPVTADYGEALVAGSPAYRLTGQQLAFEEPFVSVAGSDFPAFRSACRCSTNSSASGTHLYFMMHSSELKLQQTLEKQLTLHTGSRLTLGQHHQTCAAPDSASSTPLQAHDCCLQPATPH